MSLNFNKFHRRSYRPLKLDSKIVPFEQLQDMKGNHTLINFDSVIFVKNDDGVHREIQDVIKWGDRFEIIGDPSIVVGIYYNYKF